MNGDDAMRQRLLGAAEAHRTLRRTGSFPTRGACTPAIILASVDLPAPFSPTRPRTLPGSDGEVDAAQRAHGAEAQRQPFAIEQG